MPRWQGRHAGHWVPLGAFSFNGNKIMTTGGGGMLVGDAESIDRARYLSQQARQPVLHYEHTEVGFNYRMSNLLAAVGRGQLADAAGQDRPAPRDQRGLPVGTGRRSRASSSCPGTTAASPNGWLTLITLDPSAGLDPDELCARLEELDIEARPAWKPMHLQPVFAGVPVEGGEVAEDLYRRGVCLPSGSGMTDADVERVVEAISGLVQGV